MSEQFDPGYLESQKRMKEEIFQVVSIVTRQERWFLLVRFPNCHECQLGFQYPKKWEIGKQWPVVENKYNAAVAKLCKIWRSKIGPLQQI